ncbi:MAG: hypothetical protein J5903_01410, partial [Clostridia bacterium]|nr:hypothetical protein [Clostridia bacterium]
NDEFIYKLPVSEDEKAAITEISFAPTGEATFSGVLGSAKIGDRDYSCYVYRTETEGVIETYAQIGDFYIYLDELVFGGVDTLGNSRSTFRVKAVKRITQSYSYKFIDGYYRIYVTQGPNAARNYLQNDLYGILSMSYEYDENGDVVTSHVNANFGEMTGLYDLEGNLLNLKDAEYEYKKNEDLYRVTVTAEDGYVYRLYFGFVNHEIVRATGYFVYAYTREETITTSSEEDGGKYKVTVERYVASDRDNITLGSFMQVGLAIKTTEIDPTSGEYIYEKINLTGGLTHAGKTYFVSRTFEQVEDVDENGDPITKNGKILSSVYYKVDLTENESDILENENAVNTYKSVSVTEMEITVYVSEDEKSYVELFSDGSFIVFVYEGVNYFVESAEYDETTQTYTVTSTDGGNYTIALQGGGVATFTHIISEEEKTEEARN